MIDALIKRVSVLTRTQFLSALQSSLQFLGYNTHRINTHSFRIGAATYYAMLGLNEDEIKKKGRWSSNSYQRYIRNMC
jgi:hypothetical protein